MKYNVGDVIEVTNTKGRPLDFVRNDMNHYPVGSILEVIDIKKSTDNPKINMYIVSATRHVEAGRGNNYSVALRASDMKLLRRKGVKAS